VSSLLRNNDMNTEESKLQFYWQNGLLPKLELATAIALRTGGECGRLYLPLPQGSPGVVITVQVSSTTSHVRLDVIPGEPVPGVPDIRKYITRQEDIDDAAAIIAELKRFDVATLSDCVAGVEAFDGYLGIHVLATADMEHCFSIRNPHRQTDLRYREVMNVYTRRFLGGCLVFLADSVQMQ